MTDEQQLANRRGAVGLSELAPAAIAFVLIAVTISIGSEILGGIQEDQVTNTAGCNATDTSSCGQAYNTSAEGVESLGELGSWLPLIALVIAAAVVIGVLSFFRS